MERAITALPCPINNAPSSIIITTNGMFIQYGRNVRTVIGGNNSLTMIPVRYLVSSGRGEKILVYCVMRRVYCVIILSVS